MRHEFLDAAISAVRSAARLCQAVRARPDFESHAKKDRTPVTVADYGSQALVCKALNDAFPQIPIVGEEGAADLRSGDGSEAKALGQVVEFVRAVHPSASPQEVCDWIDLGAADPPASGSFWTLDPIDGTKGFLRNEQYAVALALIHVDPSAGASLELAVMACPGYDSLYVAVRGQGACAYSLSSDPDRGGGSPRPIRVRPVTDGADARLCESVESSSTDHSRVERVVRKLGLNKPPLKIDSQAKYAAVAQGDAEIYLRISPTPEYREKIWDHGAGALIVMEAGGVVTDLDGKPFDFSQGRSLAANRGVIAAVPALHAGVVEAISQAEQAEN